ncbi:hypothetical protein CONPUDRAFT_54023, partial [Coniophora puteana RWD-64-598 SS2]
EEFFKQNGSPWSELMHLPYFDLVWHSVIDPMHNLLLGIVRTQWHPQWIKTNTLQAPTAAGNGRELGFVHQFLSTFESPAWAGKLPTRIGEPAGSNLTADSYKFAMLTAWPLVVSSPCLVIHIVSDPIHKIPIVWDIFINEAIKDQAKDVQEYPECHAQWQKDFDDRCKRNLMVAPMGKCKKKDKSKDPELIGPKPPMVRMQPDEPINFLRISAALKVFCASSVSLYGVNTLKPNSHWAVHLCEQVLDYGPIYNFWAFLSEHLNKVLKSATFNKWVGGQIEITMMCEFTCSSRLDTIVSARLFSDH